MPVTVNIPTPLRKLTNNLSEVELEAGTVGQLIDGLEDAYAGIAEKLLDDGGEIRRYVNIFVNVSSTARKLRSTTAIMSPSSRPLPAVASRGQAEYSGGQPN